MPMHHVVVRWIAWRWAIGPGQERLSPAREALAYACAWAWRGPGCRPLTGAHHRNQCYGTPPSASALGTAPRDGVPALVPFRTEHLLGVVVNWPSVGLTDDSCAPCWSVRRIPTHGRLTPCGN